MDFIALIAVDKTFIGAKRDAISTLFFLAIPFLEEMLAIFRQPSFHANAALLNKINTF